MTGTLVVVLLIALSCLASLAFATLSYSVRELSRVRLGEALAKRNRPEMLEITVSRSNDLVLATAIGRLVTNILVLLGVLYLFEQFPGLSLFTRYALSLVIAGIVTLIFSVALPHALARYSADAIVAQTVDLLHILRLVLLP